MSSKISIKYFDRNKGMLETERVYADRFLYWLYNSRTGELSNTLLFKQKYFSLIYGWIHKQRFSKRKVAHFIQKMNVNKDELICSIQDFTSFNDFFKREINLSHRPIDLNPYVCIAPVDGKILAYPSIEPDRTFRIKGSMFNLRSFLYDETLVERFSNGSIFVSRLSLMDYHHFHFSDSGIPAEAKPIKGKYFASGPYSLRKRIQFYSDNYRMLTIIDSDHFGKIAMIEIGALTVGSIQQRYRPGDRVVKGDRKGFFEMGGSTVVLLFEKGRIELDTDLCENTRNDIETYVLMGDSIGRVPKLNN
ncbi:MAG TPA: archaetidylserine decarboxylase [Desulfobacterales bacterium]|nr:archaetidylserine decarboxylase [Desulfobacterales bacterium]